MTVTRRVGDIADVFNGKTPAKADQRVSGFPVLKIKDVNAQGQFSGEFQSFVDDRFAQRHKKKCLRTNDILVLNAAHNADYVGSKQYLAEHSVEGSLATGEWLIARSKSEDLNQRYLWHWFQSPQTRFKFKKIVKGIHLYPKDVADQLIALPPIEEQRRIAAILDKADVIRRKRQQALTLADDFLRSTFLEMFGDPVVNPKGYPEHSLGNLVDVRDGTHDSPKYVDEGYPLITSKNVTGGRLDFSTARNISERDFIEIGKRSSVEKGNILMPMIGTIGKPIIVDTDRQFAIKNVALLRTDGADPLTVFLLELLKGHYLSHAILKSSRGGTQKFIALSDIRLLPICLPPKEQLLEFSSIVQKIEGLKVQMANACVYSDQFFEASSQRLFRGDF
ncbi:restriction endonuclease subunit S [Thalassospira sp. A40-3]|uniref:restriction endonuclease subunit S n=1 Tax=Thalassospira sp. A40-3 TaxID=2785908 RepID=UPI0018CD51C7|nr:restriction endonuclease subunit S [Thalassospira sp. A40-3]QPO11732.1 restriction endonuclease subunit S [Thalassospira sp. A40-3]